MYVDIRWLFFLIIGASMLVFRYPEFLETEQAWGFLSGRKGEVIQDGKVTFDGLLLHSIILAFIVVAVSSLSCSKGWKVCKKHGKR